MAQRSELEDGVDASLGLRRSTRARIIIEQRRDEEEDRGEGEQEEESSSAPARSPSRSPITRKKRPASSSSSSSTAKDLSGKLLSELIAQGLVPGAKRLLAEPGCKAATLLAWPATCSPQSFFQCLCKWYGFVKGSQRLTFRLSTDSSDKSETLYVQNKDTLVRNIVSTIANALAVDACNLIITTGKSTQRIWDGRLLKAGGNDDEAGGGRSLDDLAQLSCKLRTSARRCDTLLISVIRQATNGSDIEGVTPSLPVATLSSSSSSAALSSSSSSAAGEEKEEKEEGKEEKEAEDVIVNNEESSSASMSDVLLPSFLGPL